MLLPDVSQYPADFHELLQHQYSRLAEALGDRSGLLVEAESHELGKVIIGSDFVVDQLVRHPHFLSDLLESDTLDRTYKHDDYRQRLEEVTASAASEEELMKHLRDQRQFEMIRLIWRDLTRKASMRDTTKELSWMADAFIDVSLNHLYQFACERWGTPFSRPGADGNKHQQYMVVIGMGKLGANELNLSSDIDLMFCFSENGETEGARKCLANQDFFIRLGQKLIQVLDTLNGDGFVFRVDMRLRPFGSASPLACSFNAMELYYQDHGRDWERYAMIKARIVAGDQQQGERLLQALRPFVYRKYIDFSAFESLREMKEMINREVRRKGLENNVKLGSGGIREVEFIAQAFQLIRGGRDSRLQQRELLNILPLLPEVVGMPENAVEELTDAYTFLRNAEHAIQAVADKQTQELPVDPSAQARLAFIMGFESWGAFLIALDKHRAAVRSHFADVIAPAEEPQSDGSDSKEWIALWEQQLQEDEALNLLGEKGYDDPQKALTQLTDLQASRTVQFLQQTGVERLKAVLPSLLEMIAHVENSTETLARVLQLVQAVLRRSAYLVLLAENPAAMQQLVKLCSSSVWFAEQLAKKPVLLDELIDPHSLYSPPDKAQLNAELRQQLLRVPEEDVEQIMESLRYFKSAHLLKVAASDITGALPLMKVSDYLTWLAEVILESVLDVAWRLMVEKHGRPSKKEGDPADRDFIIVGYGKLGGIELSYGSDLDLVFIHDCDPNQFTEGDKSIANSVFFTRLGQRIIHILNTFTAGGQLYEVDMRLRPSGNSGLLVSSLSAFEEYQRKEAWTWEHQALVRARVVAGSERLGEAFNQVRANVVSIPRDVAELKQSVSEMREKMRTHLGTSEKEAEQQGTFNLKQDQGGIVDIEFLVQYHALAYGHQYPELYTYSDNIRILDAVEKTALLSAEDAELLREAYKAYRALGHRLTLQDQSNVINESEISDARAEVTRIWQAVMV